MKQSENRKLTKEFFKNKDKRFALLNNRKANLTGFTLVELLVVIAVIGILASIVVVSLAGNRPKARDAKAETEIRQIMVAFEMKYTGQGKYPDLPPELDDIPDNDASLAPYLSPTPYSNGIRNYQWYNKGNNQKFCLLFEYETQPGNYFTCSHLGCYVNTSPQCPNFDN